MYIPRVIEKLLPGIIATFPCLAITGPRQSGKSTLLRQILTDFQYITLDDPAIREQALNDPVFFLDSLQVRCIIFSIQACSAIWQVSVSRSSF